MSLTGDRLEELVLEIGALRAELEKRPRLVWGVVTSTSPLRVRIDGDTSSTAVAGSASGAPVVGSRVYCSLQNGRLTVLTSPEFPDIPDTGPTPLGTQHLDTVIEPGEYYQPLNANAASAGGYPADFAGSLVVRRWSDGSGQVAQTYHVFGGTSSGAGNGVFVRSANSSGAFSDWHRVLDSHTPGVPFAMAAGTIITGENPPAGERATFNISFPAGRFTVAPIMSFNGRDTYGGAVISSDGISTTGARIVVGRPLSSYGWANGRVQWTAVQMTPTSAGG